MFTRSALRQIARQMEQDGMPSDEVRNHLADIPEEIIKPQHDGKQELIGPSRARPIGIVGESYFQEAITRCAVGQSVALIAETGNPIDPCAIMVWNQEGHQIGYLPLGSWAARAMPARGYTLYASISAIKGDPPNRTVTLNGFHQRSGRLFEHVDAGDEATRTATERGISTDE